MTRLYVSGPITGLPDLNRAAFAAAAEKLRAARYDVVNPHDVIPCSYDCSTEHEHGGSGTCTWAAYLRADLREMLTCDGIALLPGWENSRGAQLELHVAKAVGMVFAPLETWLP